MNAANCIHWCFRHKLRVFLLITAGIGVLFFVYQTFFRAKEPLHYSLTVVKRGTITSSVAGTGHVSASNQFDIKSRVSGTIVSIDVANGKHVEKNDPIIRLDAKDAVKAVRDAQVNLQSAQLSLKKLQQSPDRLTLLQAQNALTQSQNAKQKAREDLESSQLTLQKMTQGPDNLALLQASNALASSKEALEKIQDDLKKFLEDGYNAVADSFLNFPSIISGLNDMFFVSIIDRNQLNIDWYANQITRWESEKAVRYKGDVVVSYDSARAKYSANFDRYKISSRNSDPQILESLIVETYETSKSISDAVKAGSNFIDLVQNILKNYSYPIPSIISTHKSTLITYTNQSNTSSSSLLAARQAIDSAKTSIVSAQRAIDDKTESLRKLKEGADPLDIQAQKIIVKQRQDAIVDADRVISEKAESLRKLKEGVDPVDIQSQELVVTQRQNALFDAQENLNEYIIRAPFSGNIADTPVKVGDMLSPTNTALTIITQQSIAELSLNEVDVAKTKRGQKVTLTFDAIPDLSISGIVSDIDTVGTVSQGVVTYMVKVAFDTQDERVKPGMSVGAIIITDTRDDVLMVPNSAIKSQGEESYVDVPTEQIRHRDARMNNVILLSVPKPTPVSIGVSNDISTEIVSGLNEGDIVVIRVLQPQNMQPRTQAPSFFGSPSTTTRTFNGGTGSPRPSR